MIPPRITANIEGPAPWSLHLTATPDYLNGGAVLGICVDPPIYAADPEAAKTAGWEVTATLYAIIARTGKIPADEMGMRLLVGGICQWMNDALGRGLMSWTGAEHLFPCTCPNRGQSQGG